MKQTLLILLMISLSAVLVFANVDTLEYPGTVTETETTEVTVNIEEGWNMVHGFANPEWIVSGDLSPNDIKVIYGHDPQKQKYLRFFPQPETDTISESNFRWFIKQNSFWVYTTASGRMTYKTPEFMPLESVSLFKGWNFVGFTPNLFYDDTFSWNKVKGACNFEKIYAWNYETKEWITVSQDLESFDLNDFLGSGMIVKASGDCKLSKPENTLTEPPTLPN